MHLEQQINAESIETAPKLEVSFSQSAGVQEFETDLD